MFTHLSSRTAAFGVALIGFALLSGHFARASAQSPAAFAAQAADVEKEQQPEGLVLETAETIEFTTDEGTWMSLDTSPDGQTIVFDLLGDIYTLSIGGGEARRIVGGLSFESQPRFSPDGKQVAFLSDRTGVENLWLAKADGTDPKPLSKDGPTKARPQLMSSPSWVADGQYVLVSKQRPPESTFSVFMYHRDGGTDVRIGPAPAAPPEPGSDTPPRPALNKLGAIAAPDGKTIYFAQRTGVFNYNALFPLWQIERFDRDTGETTTVTNAPGSAMRPVLSPDGRYLVYGTRHKTETGLRVRDLKTGSERWLIHPVTRDDQESRATRDTLPGYAFLPDGTSLVVPIGGKIHHVDFATGSSSVIPFTAKVQAEIAPRVYTETRVEDGPTVRARLVRSPVLSPDGRRVAFNALSRLDVMELPDGTPHRLTSQNVGEFMPAWSPDGRYVVFVTWSPAGGHIQRVAATGGTPETLTREAAYYADPIYSPDGTKIVFVSGSVEGHLYSDIRAIATAHVYPENGAEAPAEVGGLSAADALELKWIPATGGEPMAIGTSQRGRYLHFTKDPARVYLTTQRGLVSIRLDGVDRRRHFTVTGTGGGPNPPSAEEIRLSPDGDRAFVSLQNKHYLVAVPRAGRDVLEIKIAPKGDAAVPVKRMSMMGGDALRWTADGSAVTWALGAKFFRQAISADTPEEIDIVVEAPRARPKGTVVLRGARIVTMKGDEVIARGDIVVTDNRITAVGRQGAVPVPPGVRVIDVRGTTIIPGFVDVHSHMWAPRGLHQSQVWQHLANLAYGVTTTRDPQTATNDVFAYADLIDIGEMPGPRVYATGPGVFSDSGLDDRQAAFDLIRRYRDAYRTNTLKQYVAGDRLVRQWVIEACKEYGIVPTTEGALDLKLDLTQMADGFSGHEHSLPIHPLYKDVTTFVAKTGTFYTPTILVAYGAPFSENYWFETEPVANDPKLHRFVPEELLLTMLRRRAQWFLPEEYGHRSIAKGIADVVRAGGRAGLGSHGQLQGLGAHWEIWNLQSGGLTPHETLRVVTLYGAEAIGMQKDLGSLEVGKLADLIVLEKNPLEDIRHTKTIRYVMKNGELYNGDTLDQMWPEQKKLERMFWWDTGPPPTRTVEAPKATSTARR